MCAPSYYGIEYEINPWMSRARQSDPQRAQEQWNLLCRILSKELSVEILLIDPKPGLPDMVFTANAGLVWNDSLSRATFAMK
jgi:N-dimethylarginine dimethylaminohydrolase